MTVRPAIPFLAMMLLVSGCSSLNPEPAGDYYTRQLIGTWSSEHTDSRGNLTSYGEKTYYADGTAKGFIVFPASLEAASCTTLRKLTFESRWKVEGDVVETTDALYEPSSLNDNEGERIRDRIISINDSEAHFENLSDRSRFTRKRIR